MKLGEETFRGTKKMIEVVFTIIIYLIACKLIHPVEASMSLQHVIGSLDIQ